MYLLIVAIDIICTIEQVGGSFVPTDKSIAIK